jgi:hypothetical protein
MSLHAVGDGDEAPAAHTKPDWVREAALAWVLAVTGACAALAGISVLIRRRPVAHRVAPAPTMDMVRDLFCRMCGTALRESAQFCHFCGTPSRAPRQQGSH